MGIESSNVARSFIALYSLEILLSVGITFKISDAEIISLVEEGYNEYDADGNLKHTYPDEEVEKAKYDEVAQVLLEGTIYELTLQSGVYTFIIDGTNDRTYALKVTGSGDTQEWNRFLEV